MLSFIHHQLYLDSVFGAVPVAFGLFFTKNAVSIPFSSPTVTMDRSHTPSTPSSIILLWARTPGLATAAQRSSYWLAQTLKCVMSPLRTRRLLAKSYGLWIQGKSALPRFKQESLEPQGSHKGATVVTPDSRKGDKWDGFYTQSLPSPRAGPFWSVSHVCHSWIWFYLK